MNTTWSYPNMITTGLVYFSQYSDLLRMSTLSLKRNVFSSYSDVQKFWVPLNSGYRHGSQPQLMKIRGVTLCWTVAMCPFVSPGWDTTTLSTTCCLWVVTMLLYRSWGSGCTVGRGVNTNLLDCKASRILSSRGSGIFIFEISWGPAIERKWEKWETRINF